MIEYSEDKQFTTEELGTLFSSVKWEEAKYPARLARSMQGFSLVISAREEGRLVGLLAAMDDGEMTAYLHYLLVAPDFQRRGIGRELLLRAHWRMPNTLYRAKYGGLFRAYGGAPRICKHRGTPRIHQAMRRGIGKARACGNFPQARALSSDQRRSISF